MTDSSELKASFSGSAHLVKGEEVNLTQKAPGLQRVLIGLGWDTPESVEGFPVDLDASIFILNRDNRVRRDTDFVFYNNLETEQEAVKHLGDNTSGDADGDDERIHINLEGLGFDVDKLMFTVTIHNAEERQQTFGIVKNAYIRIMNEDNNVELARFDLTEDASSDNSIIFGELLREMDGWKFKAIGASQSGGLYRIAREYGVNVAAS